MAWTPPTYVEAAGRRVMIGVHRRPRLTSKARLRFDRHTGTHELVYPERGLVLNESAVDLVSLCDGTRTVADIAERLSVRYSPMKAADVLQRVRIFLGALATRGLIIEM